MLERLDVVERCAWFALPADGSSGTGLDRGRSAPTPAGEAYRAAG